jgi:hypothetical protein
MVKVTTEPSFAMVDGASDPIVTIHRGSAATWKARVERVPAVALDALVGGAPVLVVAILVRSTANVSMGAASVDAMVQRTSVQVVAIRRCSAAALGGRVKHPVADAAVAPLIRAGQVVLAVFVRLAANPPVLARPTLTCFPRARILIVTVAVRSAAAGSIRIVGVAAQAVVASVQRARIAIVTILVARAANPVMNADTVTTNVSRALMVVPAIGVGPAGLLRRRHRGDDPSGQEDYETSEQKTIKLNRQCAEIMACKHS